MWQGFKFLSLLLAGTQKWGTKFSWKQGLGKPRIPRDIAMTSGLTPSNSRGPKMTDTNHARVKMTEKLKFGAAAPSPYLRLTRQNLYIIEPSTTGISIYYYCMVGGVN